MSDGYVIVAKHEHVRLGMKHASSARVIDSCASDLKLSIIKSGVVHHAVYVIVTESNEPYIDEQ